MRGAVDHGDAVVIYPASLRCVHVEYLLDASGSEFVRPCLLGLVGESSVDDHLVDRRTGLDDRIDRCDRGGRFR